MPRWWNFDIVVVWITGVGVFIFLNPEERRQNRDVATRALFWLQPNERLSGSEAFSRVRSRYSGRGISRPDVRFLEKFAHFLRRSCTAVPALRSLCGSNTEASRAFCPELRFHGAGMVLPSPGVLSLGPNRVELEIKELTLLFTHIPLGRKLLDIYGIKTRCFLPVLITADFVHLPVICSPDVTRSDSHTRSPVCASKPAVIQNNSVLDRRDAFTCCALRAG